VGGEITYAVRRGRDAVVIGGGQEKGGREGASHDKNRLQGPGDPR